MVADRRCIAGVATASLLEGAVEPAGVEPAGSRRSPGSRADAIRDRGRMLGPSHGDLVQGAGEFGRGFSCRSLRAAAATGPQPPVLKLAGPGVRNAGIVAPGTRPAAIGTFLGVAAAGHAGGVAMTSASGVIQYPPTVAVRAVAVHSGLRTRRSSPARLSPRAPADPACRPTLPSRSCSSGRSAIATRTRGRTAALGAMFDERRSS
jgi:hypothetical protein